MGFSDCWIHQPEKWDFRLRNSVSKVRDLGPEELQFILVKQEDAYADPLTCFF